MNIHRPIHFAKGISNSVNKNWRPCWVCTDITKSLPGNVFYDIMLFYRLYRGESRIKHYSLMKGLHQIQHPIITSWFVCIKNSHQLLWVGFVCSVLSSFYTSWWKGKETSKSCKQGLQYLVLYFLAQTLAPRK